MEKIIEPDAAFTFAEWLAIAGAGTIIAAIIIIGCVTATASRRGSSKIDEPENWEWW